MKTAIYILGLAVLGLVGYKLITKKDSDESILDNPPKNPSLQTQPSNMFPMQISETPRVDNADQPWYAGSRDFMGKVTDAFNDFDAELNASNYDPQKMWSDLSKNYMIQ